VCNMCGCPGHWIQQCPLKPADRAVDRPPPPAGYVCKKCNIAGHWIELCSIRSAPRPPKGSVPELEVSEESREVGEEIAEALDEEESTATDSIARVVAVIGEEAARLLLVQTWQVEEQGGLLKIDGTGDRRTPGGVFFWLVKQQATDTQRLQIWPQPNDGPASNGSTSGKRRSAGEGGAASCAKPVATAAPAKSKKRAKAKKPAARASQAAPAAAPAYSIAAPAAEGVMSE